MCANHNGDIETARKMINQAASLGVAGVKFQKRDIDNLPDEMKNRKVSGQNYFSDNYYEHKKTLEFDIKQIRELCDHAESLGLIFQCTPFDKKSYDELIEYGIRNIKLASQYYSNQYFKELIMNEKEDKGIHVAVSTGMHTVDEICDNSWMNYADIVYYCVSLYPAMMQQMNFETMRYMSSRLGPRLGFSSHEVDGQAIKYAVAIGAKYIERHYTLDKNMRGHDHAASSDFAEMERIITEINEVEGVLGEMKNILQEPESVIREKYKWCWNYA
jgi:sialic acid synthase SpsE